MIVLTSTCCVAVFYLLLLILMSKNEIKLTLPPKDTVFYEHASSTTY